MNNVKTLTSIVPPPPSRVPKSTPGLYLRLRPEEPRPILSKIIRDQEDAVKALKDAVELLRMSGSAAIYKAEAIYVFTQLELDRMKGKR